MLKAAKFTPYPKVLRTVGDHLKKRRYDLGLRQKDVAEQLNVNAFTVCGWENDKKRPAVRYLPRIIELLGYYPFPAPETLGERLLAYRRHLGLSRKRLARNLGIDEMRLARWERSTSSPEERHEERIGRILASIS
jgi:transcriptional regulator with XRE-family HTH domain